MIEDKFHNIVVLDDKIYSLKECIKVINETKGKYNPISKLESFKKIDINEE